MNDESKISEISKLETEVEKFPQDQPSNKRILIISIVVSLVIIALIVMAIIFLVNPDNEGTTSQIRDIFIIFMALESVVIGVALVILIIQLSSLINLLQNEIRPIINSTSETVNTLKGTATFMSDNLSEPVIKVNQFLAMIKSLFKPSKR